MAESNDSDEYDGLPRWAVLLALFLGLMIASLINHWRS